MANYRMARANPWNAGIQRLLPRITYHFGMCKELSTYEKN